MSIPAAPAPGRAQGLPGRLGDPPLEPGDLRACAPPPIGGPCVAQMTRSDPVAAARRVECRGALAGDGLDLHESAVARGADGVVVVPQRVCLAVLQPRDLGRDQQRPRGEVFGAMLGPCRHPPKMRRQPREAVGVRAGIVAGCDERAVEVVLGDVQKRRRGVQHGRGVGFGLPRCGKVLGKVRRLHPVDQIPGECEGEGRPALGEVPLEQPAFGGDDGRVFHPAQLASEEDHAGRAVRGEGEARLARELKVMFGLALDLGEVGARDQLARHQGATCGHHEDRITDGFGDRDGRSDQTETAGKVLGPRRDVAAEAAVDARLVALEPLMIDKVPREPAEVAARPVVVETQPDDDVQLAVGVARRIAVAVPKAEAHHAQDDDGFEVLVGDERREDQPCEHVHGRESGRVRHSRQIRELDDRAAAQQLLHRGKLFVDNAIVRVSAPVDPDVGKVCQADVHRPIGVAERRVEREEQTRHGRAIGGPARPLGQRRKTLFRRGVPAGEEFALGQLQLQLEGERVAVRMASQERVASGEILQRRAVCGRCLGAGACADVQRCDPLAFRS